MTPSTLRPVPSSTPGVASPHWTTRRAVKPGPPVAGETCTLITATPPSEPVGSSPPAVLKPPGVQLTSCSAVHVPNPRITPVEDLWTKDPPPVACMEGLGLKVPDPANVTVSPLAARATSGQKLAEMLQMKPDPTRYCRFGSLFADAKFAKDKVSKRRPSVIEEILTNRVVFIIGKGTKESFSPSEHGHLCTNMPHAQPRSQRKLWPSTQQ